MLAADHALVDRDLGLVLSPYSIRSYVLGHTSRILGHIPSMDLNRRIAVCCPDPQQANRDIRPVTNSPVAVQYEQLLGFGAMKTTLVLETCTRVAHNCGGDRDSMGI